MINIGLNPAAILGFLDLLVALGVFVFSLIMPGLISPAIRTVGTVLYVLQAICVPIVMVLVGFILVFQGWRLDPILQFSMLLLHIVIVFLVVKDWVLLRLARDDR